MLNSQSITTPEIFFLIYMIAPFLYSIYHVLRNEKLNTFKKSVWILVLICGSFVGLLLYWIYGRKSNHA